MGSFLCKKLYHVISFYFSTHDQVHLTFDLENSMILYYALCCCKDSQVLLFLLYRCSDCTDNHLVRELFLEVFLKESI